MLVLHGWGASIEAVYPIVTGLSPVATVHALDLPGFGQSEIPPQPWGVEDYQAFVAAFMDALEIEAPTIVGHSNGGRIAIRMAATEPARASRLVLVDSAGIRPKRTLRWYRRVGMAKVGKYAARFLGSPGERLRDAPGRKSRLGRLPRRRRDAPHARQAGQRRLAPLHARDRRAYLARVGLRGHRHTGGRRPMRWSA